MPATLTGEIAQPTPPCQPRPPSLLAASCSLLLTLALELLAASWKEMPFLLGWAWEVSVPCDQSPIGTRSCQVALHLALSPLFGLSCHLPKLKSFSSIWYRCSVLQVYVLSDQWPPVQSIFSIPVHLAPSCRGHLWRGQPLHPLGSLVILPHLGGGVGTCHTQPIRGMRVPVNVPITAQNLWALGAQRWALRFISAHPTPRAAGSHGVCWLWLKFMEHKWKRQDQNSVFNVATTYSSFSMCEALCKVLGIPRVTTELWCLSRPAQKMEGSVMPHAVFPWLQLFYQLPDFFLKLLRFNFLICTRESKIL